MVRDPIRIVPLYDPAGMMARRRPAPVAVPALTYRGGPLLTNVQVFIVFWGAWWQEPAQVALAGRLDAFFRYVVTSTVMTQLSEYDVPAHAIGPGALIGATTMPVPEPGATTTDTHVRELLQHGLAGGTLPAPTPNTLYFVYLPDGATLRQGGGASCQAFCGYHDAMPGNIYYAAVPYPGCQGCLGGLAPFDALTVTSSHELCEAVTDPVPGTGWYDDLNGEIGDICAWKTKVLDGYTVQQEWSNRAGSCV